MKTFLCFIIFTLYLLSFERKLPTFQAADALQTPSHSLTVPTPVCFSGWPPCELRLRQKHRAVWHERSRTPEEGIPPPPRLCLCFSSQRCRVGHEMWMCLVVSLRLSWRCGVTRCAGTRWRRTTSHVQMKTTSEFLCSYWFSINEVKADVSFSDIFRGF